MEDNPKSTIDKLTTRIDLKETFSQVSDDERIRAIRIRKFVDGWEDMYDPPHTIEYQVSHWNLEMAAKWLLDHGWKVVRFHGGAQATRSLPPE